MTGKVAAPQYRGREMSPELTQMRWGHPQRMDVAWIRARLLDGQCQDGWLEPGDSTRYDLVLTPMLCPSGQHGLLVTRLRGGDVVATAVLWDWSTGASDYQIEAAATKLGDDNHWTAELLAWWMTLLCEEFT